MLPWLVQVLPSSERSTSMSLSVEARSGPTDWLAMKVPSDSGVIHGWYAPRPGTRERIP